MMQQTVYATARIHYYKKHAFVLCDTLVSVTQLRSRLSPEKVNAIQIVRSAQLAGVLDSE